MDDKLYCATKGEVSIYFRLHASIDFQDRYK